MTTNQQPAVPTREYLAFISYRHADNKQQGRQWATWLHQALETYEVPADLVGKPNSRGEIIPERIYPIFRDEDELPAHANLANSITDALTNSRLLVVLCSPNAVASTYVADEIQYFKKLGHSDRIIAAMIDGEPNASWDVAKQESGVSASAECFPLPLQFIVNEQGELTDQRAEPIAADFRVNIHGQMHQGWTNAEALRQHLKSSSSLSESEIKTIVASYQQQLQLMLLKIIAGVLGVPLGELTKRDQAYQLEQQRKRTKRLRQWLSAVGVLAVMAVGASVYAWQQRSEAIAQRDKAEALLSNVRESLSFMNSDLREIFVSYVPTDKRVEVMKQVDSLASALQQYSIVNNSKDQRQIAVALLEKADLLLANKDLDPSEASAIQEQAHRIAEEMVLNEPNNIQFQLNLSSSYVVIGESFLRRGSTDLALNSYIEALNIRKELVNKELNNSEYLYYLSEINNKLGDLYMLKGDGNKAHELYKNSVVLLKGILIGQDGNNKWSMDLAQSYTNLGNYYKISGLSSASINSYKEANLIYDRLSKSDPENKMLKKYLADSYAILGLGYMDGSNRKMAVKMFEETSGIYESLISFDSLNTEWLDGLAQAYMNLAPAYRSINNYEKEVVSYQSAIDIYKSLVEYDENNKIWLSKLSVSYLNYAESRRYSDPHLAIRLSDSAMKIGEKLVSEDPSNMEFQYNISKFYISHARALRLMNNHNSKKIIKLSKLSIDILNKLTEIDSGNVKWLSELSDAYQLLGVHYFHNDDENRNFELAYSTIMVSVKIRYDLLAIDGSNQAWANKLLDSIGSLKALGNSSLFRRQENLGNLKIAFNAFDSASKIWFKLNESELLSIGDGDEINEVRDRLNELGLYYYEKKDYQLAIDCFNLALKIGEDLDLHAPDHIYWQDETVTSSTFLGHSLKELARYELALDAYRNSIKLASYLFNAESDTNDGHFQYRLSNLARNLIDLGSAASIDKEPNIGFDSYKEGIDIYKKIASSGYLVEESDRGLFDAYRKLGDLYRKNGDSKSAIKHYRSSIIFSEKILHHKSNNIRLINDLKEKTAIVYGNLADAYIKENDMIFAQKYYNEGSDIVRSLLELDENNILYLKLQSLFKYNLSEIYIITGNSVQLKLIGDDVADIRRMFLGLTLENSSKNEVSKSFYHLSGVYINQKKYLLAAETWMDAIKILGVDVMSQHALSDIHIQLLDQESALYLNWSWSLLLEKQYANIPIVLKRVVAYLDINKDNNVLLHSNLAHSLLLSGETDEAESIYGMFKGYVFKDGKVWDQLIIGDFKALRESGINSREFDRIAKEVFLIDLE